MTRPLTSAALYVEQMTFAGVHQVFKKHPFRMQAAFLTRKRGHLQNSKKGGTMQIQILINRPVRRRHGPTKAGRASSSTSSALHRRPGRDKVAAPVLCPVPARFERLHRSRRMGWKTYEFEGGVELLQGPDGKVWAHVCELSDLPSAKTARRER